MERLNCFERRREDARAIWQAGVDAVRPGNCLPTALRSAIQTDLSTFQRIIVVGGGKAGAAMATALEESLPSCGVDVSRVTGVVNVPNELARPLSRIHLRPVRPTGINEPTEEAVVGTLAILRLAESAGPRDLLICLLSGGGSALLCAPAEGLTLADKQRATRALHECGATIAEMNCVRKHLSRIKGGGLARLFFSKEIAERQLLNLVISDVIGDPLDVIASGPTVPDPSTFGKAVEIMQRYNLRARLPAAVVAHLEAGKSGKIQETLKAMPTGKDGASAIQTWVIANNARARLRAFAKATSLGYETIDLGEQSGDTILAAQSHAANIRQLRAAPRTRPVCIISGGETTVNLPPNHGKGGRNQQFALALASDLTKDMENLTLLCAGTDGEDGPTDSAGALLDGESWAKITVLGLDPNLALASCDAFPLLKQVGALFCTGLTDTNVMDLRVYILNEPSI